MPAPEPTHCLAVVIREALECKRTGEAKVILTSMCGHGHFDFAAYEAKAVVPNLVISARFVIWSFRLKFLKWRV